MKRTAWFYWLHADVAEGKRPELPLGTALFELPSMYDVSDPTSNYYQVPNSLDYLSVLASRGEQAAIRVKLGRTRMDDNPQADLRGTVRDLELLPGEGTYWPTHAVLWPTAKAGIWVAGVEVAFPQGPHPTALGTYIEQKTNVPKFGMRRLSRPDAVRELQQVGLIKMVRLRLTRQAAEVLTAEDSTLGRHPGTWLVDMDGATIELIVRAKGRKASLSQHVRDLVQDWRQIPGVECLKVAGSDRRDGQPRGVDLIEDLIGATFDVPIQQGRRNRPVGEDVWQGIERTYEVNQEQILLGLGSFDDER